MLLSQVKKKACGNKNMHMRRPENTAMRHVYLNSINLEQYNNHKYPKALEIYAKFGKGVTHIPNNSVA